MPTVFQVLVGLVAQTPLIRWERPPAGSLRRGLWWVRHSHVAAAIVLVVVIVTVALALYRRWRRHHRE